MTHVASLELCKELYKLSGWVDVESYYEYYPVADKHALRHSAPGNAFAEDRILPDYIFPAYDLGYLLRKLLTVSGIDFFVTEEGTHFALAQSLANDNETPHGEGKTPEDATAKLCCELIRQGVIKCASQRITYE